MLLVHLPVHERDGLAGQATELEGLRRLPGQGGVEEHPSGRGGVPGGGHPVGRRLDQLRVLIGPELDTGVQVNVTALDSPPKLVHIAEYLALTG